MRINGNNFLRWAGSLDSAPFTNIAPDKLSAILTGQSFVDVPLITNVPILTSTFGVDVNSISASVRAPVFAPAPRWNPETGKLRIFRPAAGPANMFVDYRFSDHLGNVSNTGSITVDLTQLNLGWRVHPASVYCLKNPYNANTGYKGYEYLEKYYTGSNAVYLPLTLEANIAGHPSYVGPIVDTAACPLPSVAPFTLVNTTPSVLAPGSPQIYIARVILYKAGNIVVDLNNLTVYGGGTQVFSVPTGIYDSMEVYHVHNSSISGAGYLCQYSPGNVNSVNQSLSTSNAVPNTFNIPTHAQPGSTVKIYHP